MKYENFIEFLSNLNVDHDEINSRWEEINKKKRKKSLITFLIIFIVDALIIYKLRFLSIFVLAPILTIDFFIFIISLFIYGEKDVLQFDKDYKDKVINKLLENFVEELDYIPLKGLPRNIYDEAKYGGHYNKYHSDDYFEGKIKGQKIVMADLLVQEKTTTRDKDGNEETETTTIFNGLFGKINLDKSINTNLIIKKDNGFEFISIPKLEMDSSEFEKTFNVYCDNNIIGMQLLTSDIQEDILSLYNKYKISFHISIMHNKMYILFDTGSMFEVFSIENSPNEVLEKYFDIMKFIYKLVDKLLTTIESTQI
jgi:hypothetical protein